MAQSTCLSSRFGSKHKDPASVLRCARSFEVRRWLFDRSRACGVLTLRCHPLPLLTSLATYDIRKVTGTDPDLLDPETTCSQHDTRKLEYARVGIRAGIFRKTTDGVSVRFVPRSNQASERPFKCRYEVQGQMFSLKQNAAAVDQQVDDFRYRHAQIVRAIKALENLEYLRAGRLPMNVALSAQSVLPKKQGLRGRLAGAAVKCA